MMTRIETFVPIVLSAVVLLCAHSCTADVPAATAAVVVEYEPTEFVPLTLRPHGKQGFNLLPPGELERTPRDYVKVSATVKATGDCSVELALVDILNREHRSSVVKPTAGQETDISVQIQQLDRPIAMLRTVRLYAEGELVEVLGLKFYCAVEKLPEPDVTVAGPPDDTSIQAALNFLGEAGGVVYIPAGTYLINDQVTVPCDNVTIYGDGDATIIKATWYQAKPMFVLSEKKDVRITRLLFRGWPETGFRGYSEAQHAEKPEDAGRTDNVMTRAIDLVNCENIRVDHCVLELFGHAGLIVRGKKAVCVDHCFFQKNFRYGYGYGVVPCATKECYIEDNNFENHRHGVAGGRNTMASYICRFNRFVKDTKAVPETGWKQVTSHEIDVHSGCGWLYAHDNYVEMKNGMMSSGACLRGNQGWVYRNLFVNCNSGIYVCGDSGDVWTWDNEFSNCPNEQVNKATGTVTFDTKPDNFAEIAYPYALNRMGWWPGAEAGSAQIVKSEIPFPGPEQAQVLRLVGAEE